MSNALSIAAVTAVLQDILFNEILSASGSESVSGAEVLTIYPGSEAAAKKTNPWVNVYLYQVTPNAALRNATLPAQPSRIALDLHYLISVSGNDELWEPQRLLGLCTRALARHAILSRDAITNSIQNSILKNDPTRIRGFLGGSDLASAIDLVKFTPQPLSLDEMSKLWSVFFQTKYMLSVGYLCSLVVIDPVEPALASEPVLVRNIDVVQLASPVPASPAATTVSPVVSGVTQTAPTPGAQLTVSFQPPIGGSQQATLLLRHVDSAGVVAPAQLFQPTARDRSPSAQKLSTLAFALRHDLPAGDYRASLLVDRAESPPVQVKLT